MFRIIKEKEYGPFEWELEALDPAWAKAALYFRSKCMFHLGHGNSIRARSLLAIWQELEARRKGFEAGDTIELLHAIQCCANENLPLPTWLAMAFNKQFTATLQPGGPTSLNEAFTSRDAPTTEAKRRIKNRDWQIGGKLWRAMWEAIQEDETITSMDAALTRISSAMADAGVGKTKARQLIEMVDRSQARLVPTYQPFSQFLAKRRNRG